MCAIMQPTYLPWAGYFNLMQQVDQFVFLDDVQFEHQSWQTRNRILVHGSELQLVVPVQRCPLSTLISEVRIVGDDRWRAKHWGSLTAAYGKAPHGKEVLNLLEPIYSGVIPERLADLNESIITTIARALDIATPFLRGSQLGCGGTRSSHLVAICRATDSDEYLSPPGSHAYLMEDNFEALGNIKLNFQHYVPKVYQQHRTTDFTPRLSIVDVIANLGINGCVQYVRESE